MRFGIARLPRAGVAPGPAGGRRRPPPALRAHSPWRLAQARGHVAVALGDDGFVELRAVAGEFAEAGLEHVALLELLDFVVRRLPRRRTAPASRPPPSLARPHQPSRAIARLKVRPTSRSIRCTGRSRSRASSTALLEFRAWFDAQLFGEAALVGGERQVGGEQRGLAGADDLDQVELGQRVGIGQRLQARRSSSTATASKRPLPIASRTASTLACDTCAVPSKV